MDLEIYSVNYIIIKIYIRGNMANNGIPVAVARLRDVTHRIQIGQPLTQAEAYDILHFTDAEIIPHDTPPQVTRVLELIQRMQNGPPLTEAEISEVLRLRATRYAHQLSRRIHHTPFGRALGRRERGRVSHTLEEVFMAASIDEDPDIVERRAITAVAGEQAQAVITAMTVGFGGGGERGIVVNPWQVHREAEKFAHKLPLIAVLIKEDLGATPQYSGFIEQLDATIGKCVRDSQLFEARPGPNSTEVKSNNKSKPKVFLAPKVRPREDWIHDYERIKAKIPDALSCIPQDQVSLIDSILDFVFKYKLEECFVPTYVYDTAHAYEGNVGHGENDSSCAVGATERIYLTLFNCIKGMNEGVFGQLNMVLEGTQPKSWKELDKPTQTAFKDEWNNFFQSWVQSKLQDPSVQSMTSQQRTEAVLSEFKQTRGAAALPPFVEEYIRREYFPYLIDEGGWANVGFTEGRLGGGGASQGGRRTRHKKRRNRKTHRKNKNKKSLRRR
jgi:hypothetical protein